MESPESPLKYPKIVLDEPRAIYYAGQLLVGHIEFELARPLNITAINVTCLGDATTLWTETDTEEYNGVKRHKVINYNGREEYFNHTQCVYGGGYGSQLPGGFHSIQFQFQIPYTVPSSYTGKCGQVLYTVKATIDFPDPGIPRENLEKPFDVVAPLELNNEEGRQPVNLEIDEIFSCCCNFTALHISIRLPVTGYCPGQAIPITIVAKNDSNSEVKTIVFKLVKKSGYRTLQPPSEYTPPDEVLETIKTGSILSNTRRELQYEMKVPDMIAPNLDNCDIIDMGFVLKVKVKLSGCNDDLEDETDIILGLVPIPGSPGSEGYKHPMADSLPNAPVPIAPPVTAPMTHTGYPNTNTGYPNTNTGYPNTNTGYPNPNAGYPNVSPYPNRAPSETIPLMSIPNTDIGFVMPGSQYVDPPFPSEKPAYPTGNAPYPTGNAPYPTGHTPYPTGNAPYPTGNAPYTSGNMSNPPPYSSLMHKPVGGASAPPPS